MSLDPEIRSANAKRNSLRCSAEERSARSRKAILSIPPEKRSELARKRAGSKTPEEHAAILQKAWETRRANAAKKAEQVEVNCAVGPREDTATVTIGDGTMKEPLPLDCEASA